MWQRYLVDVSALNVTFQPGLVWCSWFKFGNLKMSQLLSVQKMLMLHLNLGNFSVLNDVNVDLVTCKYHRDLKWLILHSYLVEFSDNVVNNVQNETCKCYIDCKCWYCC